MASTQVLVLGFDPVTVPGYDPAPVVAAIERGQQRFAEYGISCHLGLVPFDDTAEERIVELLRREPYACVVVGGGIRKQEELLELFERVVNLVRRHAPQAAIAFNSGPDDSADAARRWLTGP
jgi:L-lactate utilization protein LutC